MRKRILTAAIVTSLGFHCLIVSAQEKQPTEGLSGSAALKPGPDGWISLFDGKSLTGWKQTDFTKGGKVHVEPKFQGPDSAIVVDAGSSLSGFNWTGKVVPKTNYEIDLEVMKIKGEDFMCGLTFPVGDSHASLILGGWGGYTTGISSLNGMDASENETQKSISYALDKWYKVRMRVTPAKLEAWIDEKKIIDVDITDKKVSLRIGVIDLSVPIGISTYQTTSAFRAIRLHRLTEKEIAEAKAKSK